MKPLVPTFITDAVEEGLGLNLEGQPVVLWKTPLNFIWWASVDTARALATRYGAQAVPIPPYYPARWFRVTFQPAAQWYLMFPDGTLMNAGLLADEFRRNPEDQFPGLADANVRKLIAGAEAEHGA